MNCRAERTTLEWFARGRARTRRIGAPVCRSLVFGSTFVVAALVAPLTAVAELPAQPGDFTAATDEAAAREAARQIQEARDRANAAAEAFFQAESDLDVLEDDLEKLMLQSGQLELAVERLRRDVEAVAVARFVLSGTGGIPLLTGLQAPQDQVQAEVFVDVLTNTGSDVLDQFDLAEKELAANQVALDEQQRLIEQQQEEFVELRQEAEDEVVRLRAIEEERLQDEAVQRALEAQLAEERAQLEELARREAEAAARAIPDPAEGLPPPTTTTTTTTIPGEAGDTAPADGADATVDVVDGVPVPAETTTTTTTEPPPTTALPSNSGASGGTSGGRTGTGGSGSNPRPVDTSAGYLDTIICPMPGSAYGDTWGAPRSGGRRHEGVDMIAPRGIPIYAVTNGYVTFKFNRLGGNAVSLVADNGNRYYYAHLDAYEGSSRRVVQGEVIGYNGDTGNAKFSTPHLHFEIRPGGGLPVNPYPSVRVAGC